MLIEYQTHLLAGDEHVSGGVLVAPSVLITSSTTLTPAGGLVMGGSAAVSVVVATCFSFDMIEILSGDPNILRRGSGYLRNSNSSGGLHGGFTNRQPAFIPNIVHCRQTSLRAKIANGNFPSE